MSAGTETRPLRGAGRYVSSWRDDEVRAVGSLAEKFFTDLLPHRERWEAQHQVDPEIWMNAGALGLLCCSIPEQYGGGGGTFAHDLAVMEAQSLVGELSFGNPVHSGVVAHYLLTYGTEEQRHRWLPGMASGETVAAVAMSEPSGGSDLKNLKTKAVREDDSYVVNGAKTFISNGATADLILLAVKTDSSAGTRGISLLVVETADCPGFTRGRVLDKVGLLGQDTAELFFEDVRVPTGHLLGEVEGQGFAQMMSSLPQERLYIGLQAVAAMEAALTETIAYVKSRQAFDQTIFDFQNTKFVLAECATVTHAARVFIDSCIQRHLDGELDSATAAMAKWWLTEQQGVVIDKCVQLFGGYGYMREYKIARMYADARVQRIYGGSNETMKDIVARSL